MAGQINCPFLQASCCLKLQRAAFKGRPVKILNAGVVVKDVGTVVHCDGL
jgi:hypothetical protein